MIKQMPASCIVIAFQYREKVNQNEHQMEGLHHLHLRIMYLQFLLPDLVNQMVFKVYLS